MDALAANARDLEREFAWLAALLNTRFERFFGEATGHVRVLDVPPPELAEPPSPYAGFLREHGFGPAERAVLALTLVAHVRPQLLDIFFLKNRQFDRRFTEFGGRAGAEGGFVPTVETALFLLAEDLAERLALAALFGPDHAFARRGILALAPAPGEPPAQAPLRLADDCLALVTSGRAYEPAFGPGFPARRIETGQDWDDLVLHPATRRQVRDIETWLDHGAALMRDWGMAAKLRPGLRCLFYGPPGTGKTMTACLLGKATGRPVYRIDLSLVVSKYIGETEKNLARVFDQAEHRGWILFFDEADALFGKRSEVRDAHDRYANQETAFLLQRIEVFDGIAILASNLRGHLDEAFARRFECVIHFPLPRPEERARLWRQGLPARATLEDGVDLDRLAREYELSGSAIMNVIRYASLEALRRGEDTLALADLEQGIRREYVKEQRGE